MKPGEPVPLKELLDPQPPARADMVASIPPPMKPLESSFRDDTYPEYGYMAPIRYDPRWLPRWVRVASCIFGLLNCFALILWVLATFFDIHLF